MFNLNKTTILIVEDQVEIREALLLCLTPTFNILHAANGKEAFKIAIDEIPDLIITDILMPEVSGIELCNLLRNNTTTSHIPVIILTAKITETEQLHGYQNGAIDYITKPFSTSILLLKIKNILATHNILKENINTVKKTATLPTKTIKSALLNRVMDYISSHYKNPNLNVNIIAEELKISKSTLYRKLIRLTGKSANELIQDYRLKKAHQLLMSTTKNVSEISYEVGYVDPGYFSARFKEVYNDSPSNLSRNKNVNAHY
ncbi:MAG: DNA-binding response regulator [Bacteroidetes bacterium]|nr:DNA-binding response regulator [Bacteroidota bacterium]